MQEVFFLSSMDSERFSSVFRCEVERPIELPNGHHALMVSCDPPVNGQELGHPLGIGGLLLWSRFEDDDLWTFPAFPYFVQICLPDVELRVDAMPTSRRDRPRDERSPALLGGVIDTPRSAERSRHSAASPVRASRHRTACAGPGRRSAAAPSHPPG